MNLWKNTLVTSSLMPVFSERSPNVQPRQRYLISSCVGLLYKIGVLQNNPINNLIKQTDRKLKEFLEVHRMVEWGWSPKIIMQQMRVHYLMSFEIWSLSWTRSAPPNHRLSFLIHMMKHFVLRREITSWCEEQHHHQVDEVTIVVPNDVHFVAILKRSQVLQYKVWRTEHISDVVSRVDQTGYM